MLSKDNKENTKIIDKYLQLITSKNMNGEDYISNTALFNLPFNLFNKKPIMNKVLKHLDFEVLNQHINEKK
ncbi:hypothetical protein GW796_00125 [archaeon]|nr:hypothetical protein [archaeon]